MDIRTVPNPLVRAGGRWLHRVNQRHPWSHNDHFHGWILRRLPARRRRALDVGCGAGLLLSRLRSRFDDVLGVDADATMAAVSTERFAGDPRVSVRHARFEEVDGTFDTITLVAVLHHLPLETALRHAAELLEPGGRLLVVGLARAESLTDLAWDVPSSLLNPLVGMTRHPQPVTEPVDDGGPGMPMRDAAETFAEISGVARRVLPGARLRRRLFFRYTLEWTRPA
ncbi:class I SAM-dependent methyltransferase [Promicromonospora iranensis]|uniref:SAM-dependent methyltransferase n=1 Tax=Promicromonospora iranensis TaxID=1105144 RepID=A0ABU2CNM8_9MICO|nr:class I SAM-dependent methyltransferase [Promicromonospora iranensis]MDR7382940.1 SAM-dependent methyltransferase [Promicromonospora iranensis]